MFEHLFVISLKCLLKYTIIIFYSQFSLFFLILKKTKCYLIARFGLQHQDHGRTYFPPQNSLRIRSISYSEDPFGSYSLFILFCLFFAATSHHDDYLEFLATVWATVMSLLIAVFATAPASTRKNHKPSAHRLVTKLADNYVRIWVFHDRAFFLLGWFSEMSWLRIMCFLR
jgi:hypothetical protein